MFYKETYFKEEPLIGEIPKNWDSVDLGEVVEIHDSKRIPLSEMERNQRKGKYPYCGANGIIDYIDDYIFDGEFVLLAEDGGSYGRFENTAYIMSEKFWVNNHAHILRAIEGKTTNQFLKHVLDFLDLNPYIVGSTRKKLNQKQMKEIRLPLPRLNEQKAIVGVLGVVDSAILKVDEVIWKTERLKKGLMQQLLTRGIWHKEYKDTPIGKIPRDWEIFKFKEICEVRQGLQIAIKDRLKEPCEGCYKYITIQFLKNHKEAEYIKNPKKSVICTKDDVLLTRTGNTGVVVTGQEGVFHNNFFLIDYDRKTIDKGYLVYYLSSNKIQELIRAKAGSTTIPDLDHGDFYGIHFVRPPLTEQKRIAEILSSVDRKLELEKFEKAKLERIKLSLMDLLLTGKVRVKVD
jgi:type I restriction enzyme S subunit